jgi:putative hydrolase of the HAD superfamily
VQANSRPLEPFTCPARGEKIGDIRAVIFDVYGTLINYRRQGFDDKENRVHLLLDAFRKVAEKFECTRYLIEMNPEEKPEKTLFDLYHGLITLGREKGKPGLREAKVEKIWAIILAMFQRRGFSPASDLPAQPEELARYFAYAYNFHSLGRSLYPGVAEALLSLRRNDFSLGIVANAQFYTPIDLTLLLRDQSRGGIDDLNEFFDPDLTFFSCEQPVAGKGEARFRPLYDALYEYRILPEQTLYIGNDFVSDIAAAQNAGMKAGLFTGDRESVYHNEQDGHTVLPDISFASWNDLPQRLSFHAEGVNS